MRRWLRRADRLPPEAEDLYTEFGTEQQLRSARAAASNAWADPPRPCRVANWRDRYLFAERDRTRTAVTHEELCWDSPCADTGSEEVDGEDDWRVPAEHLNERRMGDGDMRRWIVELQFDQAFNVEAFFHGDNRFTDTKRFRTSSVPWHFHYSEAGEVQVQIAIERPDMAPLRVERRGDWGWRLVSTGQFADMVNFSSRQLTRLEHRQAQRADPDLVTLYMRREPACRERGPYGTWLCFGAYMGCMPAMTWTGRHVVIKRAENALSVYMDDGTYITYRCKVDETLSAIDIVVSVEEGPGGMARGAYHLEDDERVLISYRHEGGGPDRPAAPPDGLPPWKELLAIAQSDRSASPHHRLWTSL